MIICNNRLVLELYNVALYGIIIRNFSRDEYLITHGGRHVQFYRFSCLLNMVFPDAINTSPNQMRNHLGRTPKLGYYSIEA